MSKATGNTEINKFGTTVSTPVVTILELLIDSIDLGSFDPLIDSAIAMRSSSSGDCDHYITALKIYYGLNADQTRITLLYQPVYYCRTSYDATTQKGTYDVENPGAAIFYKYDHASNSFVTTTTSDRLCMARYKEKILLRRTPNSSPTPFDQSNSNDNLKDVEALYYSFQEIMALAEDNSTSYIKIYNAIKQVTVGSTVINKHDLLLAPRVFDSSGTLNGSFLNSFADLAHLCPPNCLSISFSLN